MAARNVVLEAITAIDRDLKRLARASNACRRLMAIPGVGQLTALAFVALLNSNLIVPAVALPIPKPKFASLCSVVPRTTTAERYT